MFECTETQNYNISFLLSRYHLLVSSGVAVNLTCHFCDRLEKLLFRVDKNANIISSPSVLLSPSFKQQINPALNEAETLFNSSSTMHSPLFSPAASAVTSSQAAFI